LFIALVLKQMEMLGVSFVARGINYVTSGVHNVSLEMPTGKRSYFSSPLKKTKVNKSQYICTLWSPRTT